jgi:endonuclease/exonuclease/phosphatase family metal-dependent hydrolase
MRRVVAAAAALVALSAMLTDAASGQSTTARPPSKLSPPGQVQILTVNARQNKLLTTFGRFNSLLELSRAVRFRPPAFNGGQAGTVLAPDVVVINEFRELQVEVFAGMLELKFDQPYEIIGPTDVQAAFIVNTATVEPQGDVEIVDDVCLNDETSTVPRMRREYPLGRFKETSTGAPFAIVGVHLSRDYSPSTENDCIVKNVQEIRSRLANEPSATFIAGDFNFRPTEQPRECDPDETGAPSRWWALLTQPTDGGRPYVDAVKTFHNERNLSMVDEWTYQHESPVVTCTGSTGIRLSRIDYIFDSGVAVAEAHADHPGWTDPTNYKYSDHRYVLGRFVLTGPPRPQVPTAEQAAGGIIDLTWDAVEGATGWIVYRAKPGADYQQLARLSGEVLTYQDNDTVDAEMYRYSVAPIGADTGQGVESRPVWMTADARGPHVNSITPLPGATGISPDVTVRVTFDEWVEATSVTDETISIYRDGERVSGQLIRKGGFVLKFNPTFPLKKGEGFTVVVRSVTDDLGNQGPVFKSRFHTVEPPKKRRHPRH